MELNILPELNNIFIISIAASVISCVSIESLKTVSKKLSGAKPSKVSMAIMNIVIVISLSTAMFYFITGYTLVFAGILSWLSWSISILTYSMCMKIFFNLMEFVVKKVKTMNTEAKIEFLQRQTSLIECELAIQQAIEELENENK